IEALLAEEALDVPPPQAPPPPRPRPAPKPSVESPPPPPLEPSDAGVAALEPAAAPDAGAALPATPLPGLDWAVGAQAGARLRSPGVAAFEVLGCARLGYG